jgi:K+-sensing histidine kinase KdpD
MAAEHGEQGLADALTDTQAVTDAARDAIAHTRALRDELMVLASHDIKNAVGILDSALGMSAEMPEQAASMQGMMRRATHRLGILVQALVDVDLLQRDLMPLQPAEVGWKALATPVVEAALGVAATKDVTLASRGDLAARVACDAVMVQRMVGALVEYAIANAPAKSEVDVEGSRVDGGRFRIRVVHKGRAVGSVTLDKLFTTLPLRFCRLAAIRHGASLRAVSPALDDGSGLAFEIELP